MNPVRSLAGAGGSITNKLTSNGMNWQKLQRIIFVGFVTLIIGLFIAFQILGYDLDAKIIRDYLKEFGMLAPFIFIIFYALGTIFIPSTPFMIVAGVLFGFKYGLIYTVIGGFLSSTIVFYASRKFGREWAEKILEHRYLNSLSKYNARLERGGTSDLIILRILPVMPFNVLNILMGISKINARDYILGTLFGLIPSNLLAVYAGAFIMEIF